MAIASNSINFRKGSSARHGRMVQRFHALWTPSQCSLRLGINIRFAYSKMLLGRRALERLRCALLVRYKTLYSLIRKQLR